jgi:hypothetical protein
VEPSYDELVERLEQVEGKAETIAALRAGGEDAKPALLRGMQHPAWRVRHGCLRVLDHTIVDDPTRLAVLRGLEDPHRKVRRAALHVLGCEVCKPEGYCGIEGVDLEATYLDTALHDRSGRVQASAMAAFMWRSSIDDTVADGMRSVLASDANEDLRRRAAAVLAFPEIANLPKSRERRERYQARIDELLAATSASTSA